MDYSRLLPALALAVSVSAWCGAGIALAHNPVVADQDSAHAEAIRAILSLDRKLGATRNQASRTVSLADSIRQYVDALDQLDFSHCPDDFTQAFRQHRDAWADSVRFFREFDSMRGELHQIWAAIEKMGGQHSQAFEAATEPILATWEAVEQSVRRHGVEP
ncbi:MAG: hypothetical protein QNJ40_13565 [Xanthomonadales bacterium]|nr:hypothetical protein [Xanthomonadales bacterium]